MTNLGRSNRHRFNNRLSFILTATTLVLLGVLFILYGDTDPQFSARSSVSSLSNQNSRFGSARLLEEC